MLTDLFTFLKNLKNNGHKDLRKYFDDNPNLLIECASKIKPIKINSIGIALSGYDSFEELKQNFKNIFTSKSLSVFKEQLIAFSKGFNTFSAETEAKTPNGKITSLLMRVQILPSKNGQNKTALFSLIDVTEQKRAEKELRNSEEQFKFLFDNAPLPIWLEDFSDIKKYIDQLANDGILDLEKYFHQHPNEVNMLAGLVKVINVNLRSVEFYKVKDKESLIKNLPSYFTEESYNVFKQEIIALANGNNRFQSEIPIVTPTGENIQLIFTLSLPSQYQNSWERVLVSFLDVTDIKAKDVALKQYAEGIDTFFNLTQNVVGNVNTKDVLNTIPNYAVNAIKNATSASLWIFDELHDHFKPVSWYGFNDEIIQDLHIKSDEAIVGLTNNTKKGIITNNTNLEPAFLQFGTPELQEIKSNLSVPLIVDNLVIGILFADNSLEFNAFNDEDLNILQSLANISAVSLKNAELVDKLIFSEQKFKSIVNSVGDSIFVHDYETGKIIDVNDKVLETFGVTRDESKNITFNDFSSGIYPYNEEAALRHIQKTKDEGPQLFEWRSKKKNGELFWTEINLKTAVIGDLNRIIAVVRDISERKIIQEAIKESEAKIESIMLSAPVGIGVVRNRVLEYVNEHLLQLLGFEKDEMIGVNSKKFYESLDEYKKIGELYNQIEKENIASAETRIRRKNNEIIDVIISLSPIDKTDHTKGLIFSVLDITENKRTQERLLLEQANYYNLFENSPIPLWEEDFTELYSKLEEIKNKGITNFREYLDSNPNLLSEFASLNSVLNVNQATLNLHNAKTKSELLGSLDKIFTPNSLLILKEELILIFEGNTVLNIEGEVKTLDDQIKFVDIRLFINYSDNESVQSYKAILATIDITERKLAEEQKKQLEVSYQEIFDNASDAIYIQDVNGYFLDINKSVLDMYGYNREDIIGNTPEFLSADGYNDLGKISGLIKDAFNDKPQQFEFWGKRKNGEIFPKLVRVKKGNYLGQDVVIAFALDITELKNAEKVIKKERDQAQKYLDVAGVMLGVLDKNSNLTLINKKGCEILGYEEGEILGKKWTDFFIPKENVAKIKNVFSQLLDGSLESVEYYENPIVIKNGTIKTIAFHNSILFGDNSEIIGILFSGEDITERKKAQQELIAQFEQNKLILNTTNDGFILADDKGKIVNVNPAYCKLIGYSEEELKNMDIRDVEISIPKTEVDRRIQQMVSKGYDNFETKHKTKDGKIIDLAVSIAVTNYENKIYVAAFVRDITLQNEALNNLKNSREEISELAQHLQNIREEERHSIAIEIHDDLGQSLTALKLDTSILLNQLSDADQPIINKLNSMKDLADQTIKTVQKISSELRPGILDDLGLAAALEWETNKFQGKNKY